MATSATTWVFVTALATVLLCQVTQSTARSFQPPHAVFGRQADDVQFDREVRKLPPFALFGGMSEHQGPAEDENMWREERKMPPFSVFNRPRYTGFQRDSRLVPPFAVFSDKQQAHSEHGKRQQEDFPLA